MQNALTDGEVSLSLSNGIELRIATLADALDSTNSKVNEAERCASGSRRTHQFGTSSHIWKSGQILAQFLSAEPHRVQGKSVVEIGCGTGISGLTAGALGAEKVVLTDQVILLADYNLTMNFERIPSMYEKFRLHTLRWGDMASVADIHPPFELLLGSDIMYCESDLPDLVSTIAALSGPGSVMLMVTPCWNSPKVWDVNYRRQLFDDPIGLHGFELKDISEEEPAASIIASVGSDSRGPLRLVELKRIV